MSLNRFLSLQPHQILSLLLHAQALPVGILSGNGVRGALPLLNKKQFLIPEGFAHGFLVLSDVAEFCYKVTDFWHLGDESGLAWNDPAIGIEWPQLVGEYPGSADGSGYTLEDGTPINLSDKDQKWETQENTFKF